MGEKEQKREKMVRGSLQEYQFYAHVPPVEICNEITTSFQICKKSALQPPTFFFIYQMGESCPKCSFLKSIKEAFIYHFNY